MRYIPVIGNYSVDNVGLTPEILRIAGAGLYSLIPALKSKDFGLDTIHQVSMNIRKLKNEVVIPNEAKLYIDSGGYSFIKGDIEVDDISKLVDCYHEYLQTEKDCFEHIFSLDLPVQFGNAAYNTKENVYKYNKLSLIESLKILQQYPMLQKKFYFIWQFRLKGQYEVWSKLYDELNLKSMSFNRAIGGMVGLKQASSIKYSPFVALSYRCIKDYIGSGNYADNDFMLHMLGVYSSTDRFIILIIEKLFKKYLECFQINRNVMFTYDSINYLKNSQLKSRNLEIFSFEEDRLIKYPDVTTVPNELLNNRYLGENFDALQKNIHKLKTNEPLDQSDIFSPLCIYSDLAMNKYFEHIIDVHNIVDIIMESKLTTSGNKKVGNVFEQVRKNDPHKIFTKVFVRAIMETIEHIFRFHHRYFINRGCIEKLIHAYIDMINAGKLS